MTGKDLLIAWLNDAHGMENALIQILEHQIKDAKDYPQVQSKLEQHLEQTRRHAQMVKDCIERLGGKTSTVKTGEQQTATMCEQIRREDEEMARWIQQNLPTLVQQTLQEVTR